MIKIYGMPSCPDCAEVIEMIKGKEDKYDFIDIGSNVRLMKEFIRIRDNDPVFDERKQRGSIGIPCFVLEDGSITLDPEEAGLYEVNAGPSCSTDGKGC